jgi:hypothetical protein
VSTESYLPHNKRQLLNSARARLSTLRYLKGVATNAAAHFTAEMVALTADIRDTEAEIARPETASAAVGAGGDGAALSRGGLS